MVVCQDRECQTAVLLLGGHNPITCHAAKKYPLFTLVWDLAAVASGELAK